MLFSALLISGAAMAIPKKSAAAHTQLQQATVTEIFAEGKKRAFDYSGLQSLYGQLSSSATKLADIDTVLSQSSGINGNSNEMAVASKEIYVQFGGFTWTAVYLSKTKHGLGNLTVGATEKAMAGYADAGDIVLTLWLSYSEKLAKWSQSSTGPTATYPSGMYGASYMRSYVLGNGGQYLSGTGLMYPQSTDGTYSKFVATSPSTSTTTVPADYLVAPRYIEWQWKQFASSLTNGANNFNNDSWGTTGSLGLAYSYESNAFYSAWKDDLVWLPSVSELGVRASDTDTGSDGLWGTSYAQRQCNGNDLAWSRSCDGNSATNNKCFLHFQNGTTTNNARAADSPATYIDGGYVENHWVRPAIHLNLTKADENARMVFFGNGTDGSGVITESIGGANVKVTSKEATYTGDDVKIDVIDHDRLTQVGNTPSGADFNSDGEFTASEPDATEDKTYEIVVKPDTTKGFYWADASTTAEKTAERRYRIKIKLAEMTVNWGRLNVAYGASVLGQSTGNITSAGLAAGTAFTPGVAYIVVKPTETFNDNAAPSADDANWKSTSVPNSTATEMGTYHVWYKITADYHKVKIGYYEVKINQDTLTVTVTDESELSGEYGKADAQFNPKNQDWLKNQFADRVTITTGTNSYDDPDEVLDFLDKQGLEVVLIKDDGEEVALNGYSRIDVGTYYLGLKDANASYGFEWTDEKHPVIKITKKAARVEIIAKEAGGSLKHIYGDEPVDLEYKVVSGVFSDEKLSDLKPRYDSFKIEDGTALDKTTPEGTHVVTGAMRNSNYEVTFERCEYVVDPRPIKLQIADEEIEYGTDLTNYTYKYMTSADIPADNDTIEGITANAEYYLLLNGLDVDISNLSLGEYELCARVTYDNYVFEVISGKLTVVQGNFDMSGITFVSERYVYDGNPHPAQISGTLPSDEITVSYRYVNVADGSESTDAPVEIGLYLAYATFTHSNENYNAINEKVAYIRIAATQSEANQPFPELPSDEEIAAAADLAKKKSDAKKKLDDEAAAKKEAIDSNKDMTAEDKAAAKEEIEKELAEGNAAIDSATSADGVNKAYDDGKKTMDDTVELAENKTAAKKELGNKAKSKKDAIDADANLTADEKTAAKAEIEKELEEGKKEIDRATDSGEINEALDNSKKEIDATAELAQKKGEAKKSLADEAKAKKEEIDNNSQLTEEEKEAAKKKVDKAQEDGNAAIDGATSTDGVNQSLTTGKESINKIKAEHSEESSFPLWIFAIIAVVLVLAIALIIIIKKRRAAAEAEEYDDEYYAEDDEDEEFLLDDDGYEE